MTTELVYDEAPRLVTGTVTIRDIDMPFWSMVGFMLKWAIATIPAFLILMVLGFAALVLAGGTLGAIGALLGGVR